MANTLHQRLLPVFFVLLFFSFTLCAASPTESSSHLHIRQEAQSNSTVAEKRPIDCTTEFSGDYYGFGVRLGVYFAWFSSYLANNFLPGEIAGSLDTNSIFLLALLVSLFNQTRLHQIYQVDGLMLMHLGSGFLFSSLSIWGYRTAHYRSGPRGIKHFGRFGTHFRLALTTAVSVYGSWFWWEGVQDGLLVAEDEQCRRVTTWLFGQWSIAGGVHILYILMSMSTAIYYGGMCVAAVAAFCLRLYKTYVQKKKIKVSIETGLRRSELKFLFILNRVWNLVWTIFCTLLVELTLSGNHMTGVLAKNGNIAYPAQLLPLIVGALSFIRVLWLINANVSAERKKRQRAAKEATRCLAGDECEAEGWEQPTPVPTTPTTPRPGLNKRISTASSFGLGIKHFFSPNLGDSGLTHSPSEDTVDEDTRPHRMRPFHHRYLVAWLPWLSLFEFWHKHMPKDCEVPPEDMHPECCCNEAEVKEKTALAVVEESETISEE